MSHTPDPERPVDLDEPPSTDALSQADLADLPQSDPEDERNYTDESADALAGDPVDSSPDPGEDT